MNNVLIVLGVIYFQVFFGECTKKDLPPSHKECLKELNLTANIMLDNIHEDFTVNEGIADLNKIITCIYRKQNFLNADDTLNNLQFHDFLTHHFMKVANINLENPEEAATNAIDTCKDVQETDLGDTLVKYYNCILKYLKNLAN